MSIKLTQDDVARDFQNTSNLQKNLQQLTKLRARLDEDISLLAERVRLIEEVSIVHGGIPIKSYTWNGKLTYKAVLGSDEPMRPGRPGSRATITKTAARKWEMEAYFRGCWRFIFRCRSKKKAVHAALNWVAYSAIPQEKSCPP